MASYKSRIPNYKKVNGVISFTVTMTDPNTKKRVQVRRSGFKTDKSAYEEVEKIRAELAERFEQEDQTAVTDSITFKKFMFDYFVPHYKQEVAESTFDSRMHSINNNYTYFYDMKLDQIKPNDIATWRNNLKPISKSIKTYAPNKVRFLQQLLTQLFEYGIKLEYCTTNPSRKLGLPRPSKPSIKFWTIDEFQDVCKTFYIEDFFQHFTFITIFFMFKTGLRIGETQALTWDKIDFENGTVEVNENMYYKNSHDYKLVSTKTTCSDRKLTLDQETIELLLEWKARQQGKIKTDWVFSYNGIPTNKVTISQLLKKHAKLAGVDAISPHGLRHSHASLLIHLKQDPIMIKERLGHKDVQTTLGVYGHLYPERDTALAKQLDGVVKINYSKTNLRGNSSNQYLKG